MPGRQKLDHNRVSSHCPPTSDFTPLSGQEEFCPPGPSPLRPLPASRDGSPHSRHQTASSDMMGLAAQPNIATRPSSSYQNPYSTISPALSPKYASGNARLSNSGSPYPAQTFFNSSIGPPPAPSPILCPQSAIPLSSRKDEPLPRPPPIGGSSSAHASSPTSSVAGSQGRGRDNNRGNSLPSSRASSPTPGSAHGSGQGGNRPVTPTDGNKLTKKRGWIAGKLHGRSDSDAASSPGFQAWVARPHGRSPYDLSNLIKGQSIAELWNTSGDTYVHLFPHASCLGPSFRLNKSVIASSRVLISLIQGGTYPGDGYSAIECQNRENPGQALHKHLRQVSLDVSSNSPSSSMLPRPKSSSNLPYFDSRYDRLGGVDDDFDRSLEEIHLYLPLTINSASQSTELPAEDIERLIGARNLFAFLIGQVLVGTPKNPTLFPILLDVAGQLRRYEFTNFDASTFGETPATTFNSYTDDLGLDDVRSSREKTIEAIVLGERMRSWRLYNEGFVHGVGKWDDLVHLDHPIFSLISDTTRNRMEASSMDLQTRLKSMRDRLEDFEFPSLFAGIADSKANSKDADFKAWKASFAAMKKHTLTFYRNQYGAWPPKAKSKKNDFEESGLNRLLLKEVYQDLADLYDMLVDRLSLTTRTVDMLSHDEALSADPQVHALRKLMGEFDRSSPPVKPPIPFDLPQLPDLSTTRRDFASLSEKKQTKERNKRLKADEINMALMQSYNRESVKVTAFLEAFIAFERREAHGKPIQEIASLRVGQWIFLYVVLQSLPLVVVDAPGLKWTEGVEYFLCQIPKGSPPWVREDHSRKKGYYRAPGGSIVNLPSDIVDHGVEGIYRKSHCWRVAEKWTENDRISPDVPVRDASLEAQPSRQSVPQNFFNGADFDFGLPPPPNIDPDTMSRSRSRSADRQSPRGSPRLSVGGGLEALPLPPGVIPNGFQSATRTISTPDPTKSFEDILGTVVSPGKKKR